MYDQVKWRQKKARREASKCQGGAVGHGTGLLTLVPVGSTPTPSTTRDGKERLPPGGPSCQLCRQEVRMIRVKLVLVNIPVEIEVKLRRC